MDLPGANPPPFDNDDLVLLRHTFHQARRPSPLLGNFPLTKKITKHGILHVKPGPFKKTTVPDLPMLQTRKMPPLLPMQPMYFGHGPSLSVDRHVHRIFEPEALDSNADLLLLVLAHHLVV